jgi:hypothetical protein
MGMHEPRQDGPSLLAGNSGFFSLPLSDTHLLFGLKG